MTNKRFMWFAFFTVIGLLIFFFWDSIKAQLLVIKNSFITTTPPKDDTIPLTVDRSLALAYLTAYFGSVNSVFINEQSTEFLQAWVEGIKNKSSDFLFSGKWYSTETGKPV